MIAGYRLRMARGQDSNAVAARLAAARKEEDRRQQERERSQAERARLRATDELVPQALAGWRPLVRATSGYTIDRQQDEGPYVRSVDAENESEHTPSGPALGSLAGTSLEAIEKRAIRETLRLTAGNREHAAKLLGMKPTTLASRLKALGIQRTRRGD